MNAYVMALILIVSGIVLIGLELVILKAIKKYRNNKNNKQDNRSNNQRS